MKLIDTLGFEVKKGDKLNDFRGELHKVIDFDPPKRQGSTGRIYTDKGGFYPSVFNCKWVMAVGDGHGLGRG